MYCISCKKDRVRIVDLTYHGDNPDNEENLIWNQRGVEKFNKFDGHCVVISPGYGSSHDGDRFVLTICDDCIVDMEMEGILLYYERGFFGNGLDWGESERVENSKKLYRRKRNLDIMGE
jgi:hypothetical protein